MIMKQSGKMDLMMGEDAVAMGVNNITAQEKAQAIKAHNDATNKITKTFNDNIEKELARSRQIKEEAKNLEILPTNGYVLVRIYDKNPWEQVKMTESGLIIPGYDGTYKSHETGEDETEQLAIRFAEVLAVGPEVKYIKEGDDIIFRNHTQLPAPFLGQSLWVVGQNNIIVTINEGLSERFKKL